MENIQFLVIVSICCDLLLFVLIGWLFFKVRQLGPRRLELLISQLKESQELVRRLDKIVEEKARLSSELKSRLLQKSPGGENTFLINRDKVLALHEKGFEAAQIAEMAGLTTGEVELILSINSVAS